jgi:hypothetical protein
MLCRATDPNEALCRFGSAGSLTANGSFSFMQVMDRPRNERSQGEA